jgi:hypothetical protein
MRDLLNPGFTVRRLSGEKSLHPPDKKRIRIILSPARF